VVGTGEDVQPATESKLATAQAAETFLKYPLLWKHLSVVVISCPL
jgi:hypothetical protein